MDPSSSPPPVPRPFAPEARQAPGGCGRPALIGCGVLVLLIGIASIAFVVKAKDLLAWLMTKIETQVVEALPADVTDGERARLVHGFAAAKEQIRQGNVEMPALKALQLQLQKASEKAPKKELSRDDVLDLLSALERVGGLLPADQPVPDAGEPAAAPLEDRTPSDGT